jgi:peptidoglycan/LPS O-acetylase OafA/YrhL
MNEPHVAPTPRPGGRIRELDALRGLAAFSVILFHYTSRYGELYAFNSPLPFSLPRVAMASSSSS